MKNLVLVTLLLLIVYEDFTTYTEVDEGGNVNVTTNRVLWIDLDLDETSRVFSDKGVDFFDGDFTHKFECQVSGRDAGTPLFAYWGIANEVANLPSMIIADEDLMYFTYAFDPVLGNIFVLSICEDGEETIDTFDGPTDSVTYFVTIERDDDGGANSTGQTTADIHTGDYHPNGVHEDLLSVDSGVGEQNDFRYIYALWSFDVEIADNDASGFTERLILDPAPPVATSTLGQFIFINQN